MPLHAAATAALTLGLTLSLAAPNALQAQDVAAKEALNTAPRRTKLGSMRGARILSSVRFASAPKEAYDLNVSFAFPARCRMVLSGSNGQSERFRLGDTLFGRDVQAGTVQGSAPSFLLEAEGRTETLLDLALREATFLWPDGVPFEGRGTTYTAKVGELGVLLATVDEATGRPTHMRAFGQNGRVAAEFRDIEWPEEAQGKRAWPSKLTFAAKGKVVWTETTTKVEDEWLFTDAWFLPPDRLTAVMGTRAKGTLRMRALDGAWTRTVRLSPVDERAPTVEEALTLATAGWDAFRRELGDSFADDAAPFAQPHVTIPLDDKLRPTHIRYEASARSAPHPPESEAAAHDGKAWQWRSPRNIWIRLCKSAADVTDGSAQELLGAARPDGDAGVSGEGPALRFRIGEERLGSEVRRVAIDLRLVLDALLPDEAPPQEDR